MLDKGLIGKIIQCHIDHGDPESFVVGRLVYCDSDWFLMQDISPEGRWDGLALTMQADIVMFHTSTDYLHRIMTLVRCRNEVEPYVPPIHGDPLISLLRYAKDANRVIGLELHESGYRNMDGTIGDLTKKILCIDQLDEFGRPDGRAYLSIDAITGLYVDDDEANCLEMLRYQA